MTPKQSDLLFNLLVMNLLVWGVLGFSVYGLPVIEQNHTTRATAVALRTQPTLGALFIPTNPATPPLTPTRPSSRLPMASPALTLAPAAAPTSAPIAPRDVRAVAPSVPSPANPPSVPNGWQTLGSGASVWVKLGNGGDHIDAFLEALPLEGVTLQVFAPGNPDQPIGQGTYQRATGKLVWAGGKWNSTGDWMAKITNGNSGTVQYKLTTRAEPIPRCESISYWEKIGTADVYWTRCK